MWEIVMQFIQNRGADRVILLSLLGLALVSVSIAYKIKAESYLLHTVYVLAGLVILYPAYNYAIDYIEMSQSIVNADPSIRQELMTEIYAIMEWHIWYPAIFLVPSALLLITADSSRP